MKPSFVLIFIVALFLGCESEVKVMKITATVGCETKVFYGKDIINDGKWCKFTSEGKHIFISQPFIIEEQ